MWFLRWTWQPAFDKKILGFCQNSPCIHCRTIEPSSRTSLNFFQPFPFAAILLVQVLKARGLRQRRVLELGAGAGLAGLVAVARSWFWTFPSPSLLLLLQRLVPNKKNIYQGWFGIRTVFLDVFKVVKKWTSDVFFGWLSKFRASWLWLFF